MSLEISHKNSQSQTNHLPGASVGGHPEAGVVIPPAKERAAPTLSPNGLSVAEYKRRQWFCEAQEGTTLDDILKSGYWAHVASKMTEFDRIEVVAVDGTWGADLVVLATGRTAAKVKMLHYYEFDGGYADMSGVNATHEIKHRGPRKWSIIRIEDKAVVKEGIPTREEADRALSDYMQALGR